MKINALYDASVSNAPPGYLGAVQAAVAALDALITNDITLTIDFGWGEVRGQGLDAASIGENVANGLTVGYAQLRAGLARAASSADDAAAVSSLPASDPTGGGQFFVTLAQAQALGLAGAPSQTAGWVGLSSAYNYTFDANQRAAPGLYDAIGVLEHEITEVLGRDGRLNPSGAGYGPLDLFRYSAPVGRDLTPGPGSFSIDGHALLLPFNDPSQGGDAGDWALSVPGDAFGAAYQGREGLLSATDLRMLDVIGYTLATSEAGGASPAPKLVSASPASGAQAVALDSSIILTFSSPMTLGQGALTLHAATDGAVLAKISVTDVTQVSLVGATLTVHPAAGLPAGIGVYLTLDPGALQDSGGQPFGGVSDPGALAFSDVSAADTVNGWASNVLREPANAAGVATGATAIIQGLATHSASLAQALASFLPLTVATTSVATLAYQFFTGSTPTAGGLDYLLAPNGPNPNNLNAAYYQSFNDANRYINFAVNLGTAGVGAAAFAADYGGLSLAGATTKAYAAIFGAEPSASKIDALLNATVTSNGLSMTRAEYFALLGGAPASEPTGLGAKAAMVGWLLSEAAHEAVGLYATANTAYLSDLALGHGGYGVDLIGVYHGAPYLGG